MRPIEDHLLGLINAGKLDKNFHLNIVIDLKSKLYVNFKKDIYESEDLTIISDKKTFNIILSCLRSRLIFGKPTNNITNILVLITQLINKKSSRIVLIPGNVLKAVGHFKKKKSHFFPLIRKFIMNKFFKIRILTPTPEVMLYLSAAFSYPIKTLIDYPLPKHVYLGIKLKSNSKKKNTILFSPTHRWDKIMSPIEKLLCDDDFIDELINQGMNLKYTHHPNYSLAKPLSSKVLKFRGEWEDVISLVTDFSSIGNDYFYSGGKNLIYYIPDLEEFENHEGKGPLFDLHLQNHNRFIKSNDLVNHLKNINNNIKKESSEIKINYKNYFTNLIKQI